MCAVEDAWLFSNIATTLDMIESSHNVSTEACASLGGALYRMADSLVLLRKHEFWAVSFICVINHCVKYVSGVD